MQVLSHIHFNSHFLYLRRSIAIQVNVHIGKTVVKRKAPTFVGTLFNGAIKIDFHSVVKKYDFLYQTVDKHFRLFS